MRRERARASWRRSRCADADARSCSRRVCTAQTVCAAGALDARDADPGWRHVELLHAAGREVAGEQLVEDREGLLQFDLTDVKARGDIAARSPGVSRARTRSRRVVGFRCVCRGRLRRRAPTGPTAPRRIASSLRSACPTSPRRSCSDPANCSSRQTARCSCSNARQLLARARARRPARSVACWRRARTVSNRKRWPVRRWLSRCARSLNAANAIEPGAKPTPAQIAEMSLRWL